MHNDHVGTGWAFPLGTGSSGGIRKSSGQALLEQSMKIIITTYPGERPMLPRFGCRLRDYVFAGTDPDTLDRLAREVASSLDACEPRVAVQAVRAEADSDNPSLVNIVITYTPKGSDDPRHMIFPFYSLPDEDTAADPDSGVE